MHLRYAPPAASTVLHPYLRHDVTKSPKVRTVLSLTRHISDSSARVQVRTAFLAAQAEAPSIIVLTRVLFALVFVGLLRLATWNRKNNWTRIASAQVGYLGPPYSSEQGLVFFGLIASPSEEPRSRSAVQGQYCTVIANTRIPESGQPVKC